jgi:hypothetical protein
LARRYSSSSRRSFFFARLHLGVLPLLFHQPLPQLAAVFERQHPGGFDYLFEHRHCIFLRLMELMELHDRIVRERDRKGHPNCSKVVIWPAQFAVFFRSSRKDSNAIVMGMPILI